MIAHASDEVPRRPLLRSPPLVALLVAEVVSTTGTLMTALALPWYVLVTTNSPSHSAYVVAAEVSAVALTGVPSGALAARLGARRTMLVCNLASAGLVGLVPLLDRLGLLGFPLLLVIAFAAGPFVIPFSTAQEAIVPELVAHASPALQKANVAEWTGQRTRADRAARMITHWAHSAP